MGQKFNNNKCSINITETKSNPTIFHLLKQILCVTVVIKAATKEDEGKLTFDCQHGATECQANLYHACAAEAIEDALVRLEVVTCMIRDNRLPNEAFYKCGKQYNLQNIDLIQKCVDSSHGAELLKLNGEATNALRPPITFIPTVTIDGSQGRQSLILKNLLAEVCKAAGDSDQVEKICKNR